MSMITYEKQDDVVVLRAIGNVTFEQLADAMMNYFPFVTKHLIWDYTEGGLKDVTAEDFRRVPNFAKKHMTNRSGGRTAFACPNALEYGMFRMYSTIADIADMPYGYAVHYTFEDALMWVRDYDARQ